MSKRMEYVKKEYAKTRTMPGTWHLTSYKYKYDLNHMKPCMDMLKEKKVIGLQCSGCNTVSFPPKIVCGKCLKKPDKWVPLRDTGIISSFTIAYEEDSKGNVIEKPVITVRQDGSDTAHAVEMNPNVRFKDVYVGMPVKIKWRDNPKGSLDDIEYYDVVDDPTKDMPPRKD